MITRTYWKRVKRVGEKPIIFSGEMVRAILDGIVNACCGVAELAFTRTQTRRVVKPQPVLHDNFWKIGGAGWADGINKIYPVCGHSLYYKMPCRKDDVLWVREKWGYMPIPEFDNPRVYYAADVNPELKGITVRWRSPIYMPHKFVRIFHSERKFGFAEHYVHKVTDVRLERLHDISEADAVAEGVSRLFDNMTEQEYHEWRYRIIAAQGIKYDPGEQTTQSYTNYLWHGHFGRYGMGNKQSDEWPYQYSGYTTARDSFSSLWHFLNAKRGYGWETNPWVWRISFERIQIY